MSDHYYGEAAVDLGDVRLDWQEFMHYLYLPVKMPRTGFRFPERLEFLRHAAGDALVNAATDPGLRDPYVYITARRGYATPGNPLNRPGWHCDDFGGEDLNYIWTDVFPTRVLRSEQPLELPEDDEESMRRMDYIASFTTIGARCPNTPPTWIEEVPLGHLVRLSPLVVHNTPEIPEEGGMRSFLKISVSNHRYNLAGNSHNYLFDYDWPMVDRIEMRNQPADNRDYVEAAS